MKKFLLDILVFGIVLIGLSFVMDKMITSGLHKYSMYQTDVWNDIINNRIDADLLILGSCQALYDYDPAVIEENLGVSTYVLAMSNLTFPAHSFIYEMYRRNGGKVPKYIILTLDYGDLSRREVKTSGENEQFLPLAYDRYAKSWLQEFGGYSWFDMNLPLIRYYSHQKMIKKGLLACLSLSSDGEEIKHFSGHTSLPAVIESYEALPPGSVEVKIDSSVVDMLDSFMKDRTSEGVKIFVMVAPLYSEFADCIGNIGDIYEIYESISMKYGCKFIDNSAVLNDDYSNFNSPYHLCEAACVEYSKYVSDSIKDFLK